MACMPSCIVRKLHNSQEADFMCIKNLIKEEHTSEWLWKSQIIDMKFFITKYETDSKINKNYYAITSRWNVLKSYSYFTESQLLLSRPYTVVNQAKVIIKRHIA